MTAQMGRGPPNVTVVVPAFNAAAWLAETLRSALGLRHPRELLEIIVVDDGSRDATAAVARAALAGAACAWRVETVANGGPSRARNHGVRLARGAWIQFLDDDDALDAAKLEVQGPVAAAAGPEVASVASEWRRTHVEAGRRVAEPVAPIGLSGDVGLGLLSATGFLHLGAQLFRRTWLETVGGFDESLRLIEDVDLELRLVFAGGAFRHAPSAGALFFHQMRAGSLSRESEAAFFRAVLRNGEMAAAQWAKEPPLSPARKAVLLDIFGLAARMLAGQDTEGLTRAVAAMAAVDPAFDPPGRPAMRALRRVFGTVGAERLAAAARAALRNVRKP